MKKMILTGAVVTLMLTSLALTQFARSAVATAGKVKPEDWAMFRGNAHLTGVAETTLPEEMEVIWAYDTGGEDGAIESSAAIADGTVYVGSWNGNLHAVDFQSGKKKWTFVVGDAAIRSSPAVANGKVYFGDELGIFHCVDTRTAKELWKFETLAEIISSPTLFDDKVLFGSYDEFLYCLNAKTGALEWKFQTMGYVHCTPAVVEGKTFISGCDSQLRIIDIATGKEIASLDIQAQTGASPAVWGENIYVGHYGNQFLGINWKAPSLDWQYEHPTRKFPYFSSAAVTDKTVVVGGRDKFVHGLNRQTGESRWVFPTKGRVDSSPVVVGNRVFVGSADGNLYELDLQSGKRRWHFTAGGPISASPAVAAGRLIIGTEAGKLYCLGKK